MSEPSDWFIARNKKKVGPFTWSQMVEQAGRGAISGVDMLLQEGAGKWVKAESVPGLLAKPQPPELKGPAATPTPVVGSPLQPADAPAETVWLAEPAPGQDATVSHISSLPTTNPARPTGKAAALAGSLPGYEVLGTLGRGGMGVVYKARHLALQRVVALKMIRAGEDADADHVERFRVEAQAVARLQHPNIVQIHEVGEHAGQPFFSLEFADGGTLADRITGDPWAPRQSAELTEKLAGAMQHAHDHGIVHRDLKPGNVLFSADGTPKISDFGLAKRLDVDQDLSQTGAVIGTPSYMAPEQAEGKGKIGPAADVYALGVILYELLTGRPPFKGASLLDTLDQVRSQEPVAPAQLARVPVDLETICLKCLCKSPRQRYASAAELQDDLRRFLRGEPVRARPISRFGHAWRWCLRNKAVASFMALFVVALLAGATVSALFGFMAFRNSLELADKVKEEKEQRDLADKATVRANAAAADAKAKQDLADAKTLETQKALQAAQEATARANNERDRADAELERARANLFTTQMLRAGALWEREPTLVRALLDNKEICPPERRDFAWKMLDQLCRLEKAGGKFRAGTEVHSLAIAGDGLVVGSHFGISFVSIYDWKKPANVFAQVPKAVNRVAVTVDGKLLACASADKIELRSMPSMALVATLTGHTKEINALAFSPDGKTLASGGDDQSVILWSVPAGSRRQTIDKLEGTVQLLALAPDDKSVAIVTAPPAQRFVRSLAVHDLVQNKVRKLVANTQMHALVFSPDGQTLAAGVAGVTLWDLSGGTPRALWKGYAWSLAYSPDGQTIAVGGEDRTIHLVDVQTGDSRLVLRGHVQMVWGVAFIDQGRTLVSGDRAGVVKMWNVTSGHGPQILTGHAGPVQVLTMSRDGRAIASLGRGFVRTWDLTSGKLRAGFTRVKGNSGPLEIQYSADGRAMNVLDRAGTLAFLDADSGTPIGALLQGANSHITLSPDGKRFATFRDGLIVLWDAKTRQEITTLNGPKKSVNSLAFSPDGALLASGDHGGKVTVWDLASGSEKYAIQADAANGGWAVAFSRDGKTLASGGMDRAIRLWNVADGKLLASLEGHTNIIRHLAFAGDGSTLISSASDGAVKLWNLPTLQERCALSSYDGVFALSDDGYRLATAEKDGIVKIWNAGSPIQVAAKEGPTAPDPKVVATTPPEPKALPAVKGAILNVAHELTDASPRDRVRASSYCREYKVELKTDVTYVMDMKSTELDAFLRLEDASRKEIASDDDSGGNLDARLVFVPQRAGTYYLIATTFKPGRGRYTLTVREGGSPDMMAKARAALQSKQWDQAAQLFAEAVQDAPRARVQVIFYYVQAGAKDRLPDFYQHLVQRSPNNVSVRLDSGRCAAELSLWPRAAEDYAHVIRAAPQLQDQFFEHLCLRLLVNDLDGFKQACPGILDRAEKKKMRPYLTARIFTLTPLAAEDRQRAARVAETELATMEHRYAALTVQGALDARAGRHDEAQKKLRQCLTDYPGWEGNVLPRLWLALSLHGQGNVAEARKELAPAVAQMDKWGSRMPDAPARPDVTSLHLHDWLEAQVLRREVEKLLGK